jgi:hypothetical protein
MVSRRLQQAVGRSAPFVDVLPPPFVADRAPTTDDIIAVGQLWIDDSVSPRAVYTHVGAGVYDRGGNAEATTTVPGIVLLDDDPTMASADDDHVPTALAIKTYADNLAIAGSPVATETVAGIGQLATNAEAVAGTPSTGVLALFVTPSNLASVLAAPSAIGGTTPAAATFTDLTASGTISLDTTAATHYKVTGAADMTLESTLGGVDLVSGLAAADAVTIQAASGGLDVDTALLLSLRSSRNNASAIEMVATAGGIDISASGAAAGEDIDIVATGSSVNITSTENTADSIVITSSAGGIDILASGAAAGEDIDIIATGSSVNITSTENNAGAIIISANGGASERVTLLSSQGTGADSINLESTAGGITLAAALATADAINLAASAGGVDIDAALQVNIASSQNAVDAVRIIASAGGIDIDAVGAATEDINITNTGGSIVLSATESAADSIKIESTAGGIDILASGAAAGEDIDIVATGSSVNIQATESAADSITITSTAGGIDILASGAAAGEDIDIVATGSSVNIQATESDVNAITINASGAAGGINVDSGTSGVIVDTTGAISLDAAAASNFTVTGAFALDVITTLGKLSLQSGQSANDSIEIKSLIGGIDILAAGAAAGEDIDIIATGSSVNISATESANDSITIVSTAGGIDILASGAAAGEDIDIVATGSSVNISATESAADSITIVSTAGGIDILASGAAAGEDIDIVATGSSINITATESASDAVVITAAGAAGGINLAAGTGAVNCNTDLNLSSVATKISLNGGAVTDFIGRATLVGGTVTVANTNIAAGDRIFVTRSALNASPALGFPITTISAGASFTIAAYSAAGAAVATDVSTFDYIIFRQT